MEKYKKLRRLLLIVMCFAIIFNTVYHSRIKAEATAVIEGVFIGGETLLGLIITGLVLAGVYESFDEAEQEIFGVSSYDELTDEQSLVYRQSVLQDYDNFIRENANNWADTAAYSLVQAYCGEGDKTIDEALEFFNQAVIDVAISKSMEDYKDLPKDEYDAKRKEIETALQNETFFNKYPGGKKPNIDGKVLADLGIKGFWLSVLAEELAKGLDPYGNAIPKDIISGIGEYKINIDLSNTLRLPEGSDFAKKIAQLTESDQSYCVFRHTQTGNVQIWQKDDAYFSCKYSMYLTYGNHNSSSPWGDQFVYDKDGNQINYDQPRMTDKDIGNYFDLCYWGGKNCKFDDAAINLINSQIILPDSNPYIVAQSGINYGDNLHYDPDNSIKVDDDNAYVISDKLDKLIDKLHRPSDNGGGSDPLPWLQDWSDENYNQLDPDDKDQFIKDFNPLNLPSLLPSELDSPGFDDKFPFCIPFDFIRLIGVLDAEPVAPKFVIPIIRNEELGWDYSIEIDWTKFDSVAKVCRSVEIFCFISYLILKTRSLIGG